MRIGFVDWLTGSGSHSISVPAMDGALRPNDRLEDAQPFHVEPSLDNVASSGDALFFTVGGAVLSTPGVGEKRIRDVASFPSVVSCLAVAGDQIAVGLDAGGIRIVGGRFQGTEVSELNGRPIVAPVAMHFEDECTLLIALGSQRHRPSHWKRDLMERGASGSVWRLHLPSSRASLLADGMAYPYGITVTDQRAILVSESWAHRIVDISPDVKRIVVDDLPFYPARLSSASDGDVIVCGFAPRRQLVEFVLREKKFRDRMMADVPEPYWMSPALSSGKDCWEPLQDGEVLRHGVLKSWAPTRSYGLVATMHTSGRFVRSYHSRAGGKWHGTTSAVAMGSGLFVTAKGSGALLKVERDA